MRVRTAFAVVLLSGLASLGVPSAAADELSPNPAATSAVTAPAEEAVTAPTPEPSEVPTSEVSPLEPEESATPPEDSAEPSGEGEPTGGPTEALDQLQPANVPDGPPTAAQGGSNMGADDGVMLSSAKEAAVGQEQQVIQAVVEPRLDPRASMGVLNCSDLTVPVTFDNSRSAGPVGFRLTMDEGGWSMNNFYDQTFELAAGASDVVQVPVSEDTTVYWAVVVRDLSVDEVYGNGTTPAYGSFGVNCLENGQDNEPQASFGDVDCGTSTVTVTLDNTRSSSETTYVVGRYEWFTETRLQDTLHVPAGESLGVDIVVSEDSQLTVFAVVPGEESNTLLAEELMDIDCVQGRGFTSFTVSDVDCPTMTIPVTVDNSSVNYARSALALTATPDPGEYFSRHFEVGANQTLAFAVPVVNHSRVVIDLYGRAQFAFQGNPLFRNVVSVNCPPTTAGRPPPNTDVQGTKLPQTGGFNFALPLLGVALLASGGSLLALSRRRPRN